MARRSFTRRKYVKIGWIALGFIIVFGVIANIDNTFVPTFEAIPYGVPIPLSILQSLELLAAECQDPNAPTGLDSLCGSQSAISCRVWTEGIIETETSQNVIIRTRADFDTQLFDPNIVGTLSVLDIRTGNELNKADLDIRMRCDPPDPKLQSEDQLLALSNLEFTLTGGTVTSQWVALDSNNIQKTVT